MLNLIIAGLALPLVVSILLLRRPRRPAGGWIATTVLATGMAAFSYFVIPWGLLGLPLRYVVAAVFLVSLTISILRKPDDRADDSPTRMLLKILIGLFFGSVALSVLRGNARPAGAVNVAFPLQRGPYVVTHGGSTTAANTYFGKGKEGFAVDVVGLAQNETVVSPCDGAVIAAKPLRVRCNDVLVELNAEGTQTGNVRRGAPIGRAGGEYLHVFGERNNAAVPLTFDGRWLVRNSVIRR
jgi:hypothetical protein